MTTEIKSKIKNLKENDLYSVLLYAIYKCTGDPDYSTLSELIYALNKDGLLNLCSIFGGCIIRVPTLTELKVFANALLIYSRMEEGVTFSEAFKETELDKELISDVSKAYLKIKETIDNYGKQ